MISLDAAIIEEYAKLGIPADRIIADAHSATRFCEAVNDRLPESLQVDTAMLNKRLLNIRRRSEAKGGLPRLVRNLNARGLVKKHRSPTGNHAATATRRQCRIDRSGCRMRKPAG